MKAVSNVTLLALFFYLKSTFAVIDLEKYKKCELTDGNGIFKAGDYSALNFDFECSEVTNDCMKKLNGIVDKDKKMKALVIVRSHCNGNKANKYDSTRTFDINKLNEAGPISALLTAGLTETSNTDDLVDAMNEFQGKTGNNCAILANIKNFLTDRRLMNFIQGYCIEKVIDLFTGLDKDDLFALDPVLWNYVSGRDNNLNPAEFKAAVTAASPADTARRLGFLFAVARNLENFDRAKLKDLDGNDLKALLVKNSTVSDVIGAIKIPSQPHDVALTNAFNGAIPSLTKSDAEHVKFERLTENSWIDINALLDNSDLAIATSKTLNNFDLNAIEKITSLNAIIGEKDAEIAATASVIVDHNNKSGMIQLTNFLTKLALAVHQLHPDQLDKLTPNTIIALSKIGPNTLATAVATKGTAAIFVQNFAENLNSLDGNFLKNLGWSSLDTIKDEAGLKLKEAIKAVATKTCTFLTDVAQHLDSFDPSVLNKLDDVALKKLVAVPGAKIKEALSKANAHGANFQTELVKCHAEIHMENLENFAVVGPAELNIFTLADLMRRSNDAPSGSTNSGKFHEYLTTKVDALTKAAEVNSLIWTDIQYLKKLNLGALCTISAKGAFVQNVVGQNLDKFDKESLQTLSATNLTDIATGSSAKESIKLETAFDKTGRTGPFVAQLAASIDQFDNQVLDGLSGTSIIALSKVTTANTLAAALTSSKASGTKTFYDTAVAAKASLDDVFVTSNAAVFTAPGGAGGVDPWAADVTLDGIADNIVESVCQTDPAKAVTTFKRAVGAGAACNTFYGNVSKHLKKLNSTNLNKLTSTEIVKLVAIYSTAAEAANNVLDDGSAANTFIEEFGKVSDQFDITILDNLEPKAVEIVLQTITHTQFITIIGKTAGKFHNNAAKHMDKLGKTNLDKLTVANLANIVAKPELNLQGALTVAGAGAFTDEVAKNMGSFDIKTLENLSSLADLSKVANNTILAAAKSKTATPKAPTAPQAGKYHELVANMITSNTSTYEAQLDLALMQKLPTLSLDLCKTVDKVCKIVGVNLVAFSPRLAELSADSIEKMALQVDIKTVIDLNGVIIQNPPPTFITNTASKLDKFDVNVLNNILDDALDLLVNVTGQQSPIVEAIKKTSSTGALWQLASQKYNQFPKAVKDLLDQVNGFSPVAAVQVSALNSPETISFSDVKQLIQNHPDEVFTKIKNMTNSPKFFENVTKAIDSFKAAKLNEFKQNELEKLNAKGSKIAAAIKANLKRLTNLDLVNFKSKFLTEFSKAMHMFYHEDLNNLDQSSITELLQLETNLTALMTKETTEYNKFQKKVIQELNTLDARALNALKTPVKDGLPKISDFDLQRALKTVGDAITDLNISEADLKFLNFVAGNLDKFDSSILDTIKLDELKRLNRGLNPKFTEAFSKPQPKPVTLATLFVENLKNLEVDFTKDMIEAAFKCLLISNFGKYDSAEFLGMFLKPDPKDSTKKTCVLKPELFTKTVLEKFQDGAFKSTDASEVQDMVTCLKDAKVSEFSTEQLNQMNAGIKAVLKAGSDVDLKNAENKFRNGAEIEPELFNKLLKEGKADVCNVKSKLQELPDLSDDKIVDCYGQLKGSENETKWGDLTAFKIPSINIELFKFFDAKVAKKLGSEVSGVTKKQLQKIPTLADNVKQDSDEYRNHACYYFLVEDNGENVKKLTKIDAGEVVEICKEKKFVANSALILKSSLALLFASFIFSLLF